jgi:DNA mismatch repair ATPase MutS
VLLGQTFGLTYGATGSWRPFQLLFSRLKSKDHAGKESLFEMEVRMAATMLKTTKSTEKHSLVLIDELFHSTNPPDAEISAKLFLQQLWNLPNVKSMISTHIFSLCEMPQKPQMVCVPAEETAEGEIQYSYKLAPGICRVSSVREVLKEHGLTFRA